MNLDFITKIAANEASKCKLTKYRKFQGQIETIRHQIPGLLLNKNSHSINPIPKITDIEDLNLNFKQIRQLISRFSHENLIKAVNFALDSTARSKP